MKRFLLVIVVFVFLLSGCENPNSSVESPTDFTSESIVATEAPLSSEITEQNIYGRYLIEQSEKNHISVEYPQFDQMTGELCNQLIYQYVYDMVYELTQDSCSLQDSDSDYIPNDSVLQKGEYSSYYVDIDYRVALYTDNIISIIFEGLSNYRNAAHPNHLLFTLNIDTKTGEPVLFAQKYKVDSELYTIFIETAKEQLTHINLSEDTLISLFDEDTFIDGLMLEEDVCVYYTSVGIGISYPVVYALGNHIEIEIPYNKLRSIEG